MNVLIADDNPAARTRVRDAVRDAGYGVVEATDGLEAVQSYKRHAPEAAVLALSMPRCNGVKATAAINKLDDDAGIVLATTVSRASGVSNTTYGADRYVTKPFDPDEVIAAVDDVAGVRATFVRSDGSDEARTAFGDVAVAAGEVIVRDGLPDWVGAGTEVVVARRNGRVVESFTVDEVRPGDVTRLCPR